VLKEAKSLLKARMVLYLLMMDQWELLGWLELLHPAVAEPNVRLQVVVDAYLLSRHWLLACLADQANMLERSLQLHRREPPCAHYEERIVHQSRSQTVAEHSQLVDEADRRPVVVLMESVYEFHSMNLPLLVAR
jgi:hypothetical protein